MNAKRSLNGRFDRSRLVDTLALPWWACSQWESFPSEAERNEEPCFVLKNSRKAPPRIRISQTKYRSTVLSMSHVENACALTTEFREGPVVLQGSVTAGVSVIALLSAMSVYLCLS